MWRQDTLRSIPRYRQALLHQILRLRPRLQLHLDAMNQLLSMIPNTMRDTRDVRVLVKGAERCQGDIEILRNWEQEIREEIEEHPGAAPDRVTAIINMINLTEKISKLTALNHIIESSERFNLLLVEEIRQSVETGTAAQELQQLS